MVLDYVSRAGWWQQEPVPMGTPDPVGLLMTVSGMLCESKQCLFPTPSLTLTVLDDTHCRERKC